MAASWPATISDAVAARVIAGRCQNFIASVTKDGEQEAASVSGAGRGAIFQFLESGRSCVPRTMERKAQKNHEAAGCFRAVAASTAPFKMDPWAGSPNRTPNTRGVSPNRPSASDANCAGAGAGAMGLRGMRLHFGTPMWTFGNNWCAFTAPNGARQSIRALGNVWKASNPGADNWNRCPCHRLPGGGSVRRSNTNRPMIWPCSRMNGTSRERTSSTARAEGGLPGSIAETRIEEARIMNAELADQRIERHHLGGIVAAESPPPRGRPGCRIRPDPAP